jgi:hypothetical protein
MNTSLADWLQSWGTVGGSVFSAIAAITALALYWREVSNRKRDIEDSATRQARNVLVTIDTPRRPTHLEQIGIVTYNFTEEVILDLYVYVCRRDSGARVMELSSDVFEPGQRLSRDVKLDPVMQCDRPEDPSELFEFNYWFSDSRGYNWHRLDRQPPQPTANLPSAEWEIFKNLRTAEINPKES